MNKSCTSKEDADQDQKENEKFLYFKHITSRISDREYLLGLLWTG